MSIIEVYDNSFLLIEKLSLFKFEKQPHKRAIYLILPTLGTRI